MSRCVNSLQVVGSLFLMCGASGFSWGQVTFTALGHLPGYAHSHARAVSNDGAVAGHVSWSATGNPGFRWSAQSGIVLFAPVAGRSFTPTDVSNDGLTIVGETTGGGSSAIAPFRYRVATSTFTLLPVRANSFNCFVNACSGDGNIVVGSDALTASFCDGVVWDAAGAATRYAGLGPSSGTGGYSQRFFEHVSENGQFVAVHDNYGFACSPPQVCNYVESRILNLSSGQFLSTCIMNGFSRLVTNFVGATDARPILFGTFGSQARECRGNGFVNDSRLTISASTDARVRISEDDYLKTNLSTPWTSVATFLTSQQVFPAGWSQFQLADVSSNGRFIVGSARNAHGNTEAFRIDLGAICDSIDFNNDSSIFDPQDVDAFLSVYSEGPCVPESATCNNIDFNNDGSVFDPRDIDAFLSVFSEGPCF